MVEIIFQGLHVDVPSLAKFIILILISIIEIVVCNQIGFAIPYKFSIMNLKRLLL